MTKEEKIIATAFTGIMFIDGSDMGSLYEYMEKKVGHGVIDLMLADKSFWEELHKACEQDFTEMASKKELSLPSNLDEAANSCIAEFADYIMDENTPEGINLTEKLREIFKAGAEWMANKMKEKQCLDF